ncbi:UNVERIFIED_CONTAM: hypothetical protein Sradi_5367400 [Sesamum radiatum]|uniref:Agenet domain-containing protein n=1 Tax=Sesamum radiatum TaxID=300843 RepID=A0AAW2LPE5_SESRA
MSDKEVLRAWEERVISQEKGRRIVHYILKDTTGSSLLAVVGRDRSVNHMAYVISEAFLCVFASTSAVHAGTKWRARRDVVEWLKSVVSRGGPIFGNSTNPSSLKCQVSWRSNNGQSPTQEVDVSAPEEPAMRASKRIKSCHLDQTIVRSGAGLTNLVSDNRVAKWEPSHERANIKLSSNECPVAKLVVPEPQCQVISKINGDIELLCQDSGMKGCWFRCKILHSSKNRLKVQYEDVLEVDGPGKLEEWVPAYRVVAPDRLGVRCVERLTVRPRPCEYSSDIIFEVGAAVDAWWCSGWWEGVVLGYDTLTKSNLQVYFPGENRFLTIARKNIRVSRDWIDNKWVNIEAKSDILSFLSSIFSTEPQLLPLPVVAEANSSAQSNSEVLNPQKLEGSEDDKWQISSSSRGVQELNLKKRLMIKCNEEMYCRSPC